MKKKPFIKVLQHIIANMALLLDQVSNTNRPGYYCVTNLDPASNYIKNLSELFLQYLTQEGYDLADFLTRDKKILSFIFSNKYLLAIYHHLHLSDLALQLPITAKPQAETQDITIFLEQHSGFKI